MMNKIKILLIMLLMTSGILWGQSGNVQIDRLFVLSAVKTADLEAATPAADSMYYNIVFKLDSIQVGSGIHIKVADSLGGTVILNQTYDVHQTSADYFLRSNGINVEKINGGYIYFDIENVPFEDRDKYRYFEVWATDTQSNTSVVKSFTL